MAVNPLRANDTVVGHLTAAMRSGEMGLRNVPGLVRAVIEREAWRAREVERLGGNVVRFDRFVDFVKTAPLEGLGATEKLLRNLVRDDAVTARLLDEALVGKRGGDRKSEQARIKRDNVTNDPPVERGNARPYALRKLRKDRPDLLAAVERGEKSPHRAMVEAGFRKQPTDLERLERAWANASPAARAAFLAKVVSA